MLRQNNNANKPKTWQDWLLSRQSVALVNNSRKEQLFKTVDSSVNNNECKQRVLDLNETAFLFKLNVNDNRVNIFHHLYRIGGNIYDSKEVFGAIQGIGEDTTCIISPDEKNLFELPSREVKVPDPKYLLMSRTKEDIMNLLPDDSFSFLPRNFIPIPPFLLEIINNVIESSEGNTI